MTVRPILGADEQPPNQPSTAGPGKPAQTQSAPELPLANQLPAWDLVPNDLLLVRRRPARS